MPILKDASLIGPSIINGLGTFTKKPPLELVGGVNGLTPGSFQVNGDMYGRGGYYQEGADGEPTVVLLRDINNSFFNASRFREFYDFKNGPYVPTYPIVDLDGTIANIHSIHTIDKRIWVTGISTTFTFRSVIIGKDFNGTLVSNSSWANLTIGASIRTYLIRKAKDADALYCLSLDGFNDMRVMTRSNSAALSTPFTLVPGAVGYTSGVPTAYGVSTDGQSQFMSYGTTSEIHSINGGANWTSINTGISNTKEFVYCKAFNRWVTTGGGVTKYTDNGHVATPTWVSSTQRGSSSAIPVTFTHIERIDPDGRYLLGVAGTCPIYTYISEDGGGSWAFSESLLPDNYNTDYQTNQAQTVLVNTGTNILLYMGALISVSTPEDDPEWNWDNCYFKSGLIGSLII